MSWRLKTRTAPGHRRSALRWWMGATLVATGALVGAYLLDPERGHARRARVAESAGPLVRKTRSRISHEPPSVSRGKDVEQPATWPEEAPPDVDSES